MSFILAFCLGVLWAHCLGLVKRDRKLKAESQVEGRGGVGPVYVWVWGAHPRWADRLGEENKGYVSFPCFVLASDGAAAADCIEVVVAELCGRSAPFYCCGGSQGFPFEAVALAPQSLSSITGSPVCYW